MLISVLLPALNSARQTVQAASCFSNLRQLNLALLMSAGVHDGRLPHIGDIDHAEDQVGDEYYRVDVDEDDYF